MEAIIRFLQDTGFYLFTQDGNWRCLVMIGIACVLLYLGIVKKFEPLLLVPIAFGMLITNLPGANMFHEIFFAGGHIHWDIIGGKPITAELLSELYNQGVAENVLSPYLQQLMTAAQTMFSPEAVSSTIAEITASATDGISAFGAQLEALVQAEPAAGRGGAARYFCHVYRLPPYGLHRSGIQRHRHHRRRGRSYGHFCHRSAGPGAAGSHCRGGLLLYGAGSGHSAAHHEAADHGKGTPNRHEASAGGQQAGKDCFPHCCDCFRGAAGALCRAPHCLPDAG